MKIAVQPPDTARVSSSRSVPSWCLALHLLATLPPRVRIHGKLTDVEGWEVITNEELKDLNSSIFHTVKSVFPYIRAIPGYGTNLFLLSDSQEVLSAANVEVIRSQHFNHLLANRSFANIADSQVSVLER